MQRWYSDLYCVFSGGDAGNVMRVVDEILTALALRVLIQQ